MYVVEKFVGETPLEVLARVRVQHGIDSNIKMAYAGRLDPLASGVMVVLVGEECVERKEYEQLDKEYIFEVLLGVETDTHDLMGIITRGELRIKNEELIIKSRESVSGSDDVKATVTAKDLHYSLFTIHSSLQSFVGSWEQAYPPYASARVGGHPLYWWARRGRLDEIKIPTKMVTVKEVEVLPPNRSRLRSNDNGYEFHISCHPGARRRRGDRIPHTCEPAAGEAIGSPRHKRDSIASLQNDSSEAHDSGLCTLMGAEVARMAIENIGKVHGDFRQDAIIDQWERFGQDHVGDIFPVIRVRMVCSSGTYVRGICHALGQRLECGALAYSIHRTRVGECVVESRK